MLASKTAFSGAAALGATRAATTALIMARSVSAADFPHESKNDIIDSVIISKKSGDDFIIVLPSIDSL